MVLSCGHSKCAHARIAHNITSSIDHNHTYIQSTLIWKPSGHNDFSRYMLCRLRLFAATCQAALCMEFSISRKEFSRQEYWSVLPFPTPGHLPDLGLKHPSLGCLALAGGFFTASSTWEDSRCACVRIAHNITSLMDHVEKAMATHSSTVAWKITWTEEPGRLQSMGVVKSRTRLSDFTFPFHFHALEKEMATHSSVLAWIIPGIGEPGRLPSLGSHRVRHDWSDLAIDHDHTYI